MIGPGSSSNSYSHALPPNSKAAEAELISRATQTAIVAARSILMSGGSQEVALKTAKAAAESVLNPAASDTDTVSGRSTLGVSTLGVAFGGRKRKAKRQAEVVASMALMSATSAHPSGGSSMGEMYGRNIITVRQDEPSVLSGSITSRPKIATPKSLTSHNTGSFMGRSQQSETRDGVPSARAQKASSGNRESMVSSSSPLHNYRQGIRTFSPRQNNIPISASDKEDGESILPYDSGSLSQSSTLDSHLQSSVESSLDDRSSSEDESDTSHIIDHIDDRKETRYKKKASSEQSEKTSWNLGEAFLRPVTATLNLMSCGQIASGEAAGDVDELESCENKRLSGRGRVRSSVYDRRDDTFDSTVQGGSTRKGSYRDQDFTSSYSESQLSCESDITDDDSEGEIKVRSSIRETMENLVTKSKLSYQKSKQKDEKRWASYENASDTITSPRKAIASCPRNDYASKRPPKSVPSPNKSNKGLKNVGRKGTFFKKNKGRR